MSGTNKLIPLAVALFVGAAGFITVLNRGGPETEDAKKSAGIPAGAGPQRPDTADPSGDTTTETLNTISAQFNEATRKFEGDLTDTQATVAQLKNQLETLSHKANQPNDQNLVTQIREHVNQEVQRALNGFDSLKRQPVSPDPRNRATTQLPTHYPIGDESLGFEPGTLAPSASRATPSGQTIPPGYIAHPDARYLQVVPLYQAPTQASEGIGQDNRLAPVNPLQSNTSTVSPHTTPVATVPAGSTLFDATAFTALIGRIPVGGQVVDPMPIKVLIGHDNLAANGHRIYGLRGMVFSGSAIGDATLRCVKANLNAATFVFDDGSIATVDARQGQGGSSSGAYGSAAGRQTTDGAALGWISDPQGNPCIPGQLITDAPKRITTLTLAGGLAGAADAYAEQQITQSVSGSSITRSVTGSNTDFLIGSTASQGVNAALQDLQARFQDRFDAIYIEAGQSIVVHVDQTLPIDHDATYRRLNYPGITAHVSHELD